MTRLTLLAVLAALAALPVAGGALLLRALSRGERLAARLAVARGEAPKAGTPKVPRGPGAALLDAIAGLGRAVARSGLLPAATLSGLQHTLEAAGFRARNGLFLFVGGKILLLLALPAAAFLLLRATGFSATTRHVITVGAALCGLLAPDMLVRQLRRRTLAALERGIPDALDMLVICAEAGLGLEAGIARVAGEIGAAHPAVAAEFGQTAHELRILADARAALAAMGERTGLASLKRLAATLAQTLQYGTPLTQALRTLSAEMRGEMLTRFEARAARLPVLLTVPMIVFILPCLFLIVGGPAMLRVIAVMHR